MPATTETPPQTKWHALAPEAALARLESDPARGLDPAEVAARRERSGPNRLSERPGPGPLRRFLGQLHQPLVYLLLLAGAVSAILAQWVDAGVIFGVVLINAVLGYLQEAKAVDSIAALSRELSGEATVRRGGESRRLDAVELVPGDVVLLRSGDRVPADLRLLAADELELNESPLTGESLPTPKDPAPLPAETPLAERRGMAYSSTLVARGAGVGVVVAVGDETEVGRISELVSTAALVETPLTRRIARFSHVLLVAILGLAALAFVVLVLVRGHSVDEAMMFAVALAVGAIPEGLPAALTIILAVGTARMARRRAIVRHLPAAETLGSTTVICSDKTGTLTENAMTVREVLAGGRRYRVEGLGYALEGGLADEEGPARPRPGDPLHECLAAGLLCNDAALVEAGPRVEVVGSPMEAALRVVARKGGLSADLERELPRTATLPFEAGRRYMATLHARSGGDPVLYVKGAADELLGRCADELGPDGARRPLDLATRRAELHELAGRGLRVLALARKELDPTAELRQEAVSGLTLLGVQGMLDPPREGAAASIAACQGAGVQVKMVTGDHAATAASVAAQLGLEPGARGPVAGAELEALGDDELRELAREGAVFARVSPEQKLRLVRALQAEGEVVAMTGDGVNDAPALRQANLGVAMGRGGTEVAREAADMVLLDDDFTTIVAAIEEGRALFANFLKFVVWTLPTNVGEALVLLAAALLGVALPITPVQVLWINMTTAGFLGITLAFEPREHALMLQPPRRPDAPLFPHRLLLRMAYVSLLLCAGSFALFEWELYEGGTLAQARTVAVGVFVLGELLYLFECRSLERSALTLAPFANRWVWLGVVAMGAAQLLFSYVPWLNWAFGTEPIGLLSWGRALLVALTVPLAVELEKRLQR
ncbi:MAG: cation-translocating P-type ATPase [Planctomycetota bacterium]